MEPVVQLLADLVAIPSMNPLGRESTGERYKEQALADFIASFLKRHAVDVKVQDVALGRPNVLGYIEANAERTILLEAHMDTVRSEGMVIEPFTPVVRDQRLYGRGSCDAKGAIASFLHGALRTLNGSRKLHYNILFLFVSDEEYCFTGAQHAVRSGLKADVGIVGEPTLLRIVRAHKGVTRWNIITKGLAAHSAYPERGKNAIYAMAKVVEQLERYSTQLRMGKSHPLLGVPTLNIGVIEGGQAVNVVPDRCRIEVDRRTLPGETREMILDPVQSVLRNLPDWEMEPPYLSVAGMEVAERAPVVQMLADAIGGTLGTAQVEAAQYATDAGFYNAAGIPTVVFGPGDIAQAHTESEFIELEQVHHAANIIERLLTT